MLQNGQLFITKTRQELLPNRATCETYLKMAQGLLRNGAALEVYYIMGQLLQNEPLHRHPTCQNILHLVGKQLPDVIIRRRLTQQL